MASHPTRFGAGHGLLLVALLLLVAIGFPLHAAEMRLTSPDGLAGVAADNLDLDRRIPPPDEDDADVEQADDQEESPTPEDEPAETAAPAPTTAPADTPAKPKGDSPQVEVFIPSVAGLADSARHSKTAALWRALAGMFPLPADETGEDFDFAAVTKLLEQVAQWPDTSLVFATYTQDREGRARWAARVDWPMEGFRGGLESFIETEAAKKLLKDVALVEREDGAIQIELPDLVLAVITECEGGSLIASAEGVHLPEAVFGRDYAGEPPDANRPSATPANGPAVKKKTGQKPRQYSMLVYCRLNLAGENEGGSPFAMISGVKDVRYGGALDGNGLWQEKVVIRWNPLLGVALKAAFKKLKEPFECPRDAYVVAAFNTALGEGLADSLAGLPPGTIGGRASSETAFAAVPGTGFLPFPDVYFQFTARGEDQIIEAVREAVEKDTREREEEDRPIAWREETIDGRPVFWCDSSADESLSFMPATYRTVVFFDRPRTDQEDEALRLIIAQTPMWAEDAVHHWRELTKNAKSRVTVPDSKQTHWQARISWRRVYALTHPYLALLAGLSAEAAAPPPVDELKAALADSVVDIRIDYGGLQVRARGPVPVGAFYIPVVALTSLSSSGDYFSEAERERVACQHLRVLYHHAKLFKKDYGRWPASVAELDGYVDFTLHADLLYLRPKKEGFAAGLVALVTGDKKPAAGGEDERKIDDSLYVIEWSPDDWKLMFRDGEFVHYRTIYIDAEEKIHRVPKDGAADAGKAE